MTGTNTGTAPHPPGTILRLTRDLTDEWGSPKRKGETFTADEYVPADHPDGDGGPAFYEGWSDRGSASVPADAVEVAMTADAAAARTIPTVDELRSALGSALLMDEDGFTCTESRPDGPHDVEVYGRTADGLPFVFKVRLVSLHEVFE